MRTVRQFFEQIIEWDWPGAPARNPVMAWDIPKKPEPLPKFPGDRDAAKLMAAARASTDPRDRLVVELLARTGMRAGELADLDADAVVRIGAGHWLRIPLGKLRNDRYVPLPPELVQLLAAWTAANVEHIRRHKRLIADHRGPLDRHLIARIVRRVARAAGVPGVHPHRLRHTLATQAINRGMRLEAIAALLGHQKMEMTLIYAKIANRVVADEYAAVSAKTGRPRRAATGAAGRLRDHRHGPGGLADQRQGKPGVGRVEVDDPNLAVGGVVGAGAAGDGQREPGWLPLAKGPGAHPLRGDLPFGQHQGGQALRRKPLRGAGARLQAGDRAGGVVGADLGALAEEVLGGHEVVAQAQVGRVEVDVLVGKGRGGQPDGLHLVPVAARGRAAAGGPGEVTGHQRQRKRDHDRHSNSEVAPHDLPPCLAPGGRGPSP